VKIRAGLVALAALSIAASTAIHYRARVRPLIPIANHAGFAIAIYSGPSPLSLSPRPDSHDPSLTYADVTDIPARFVADPFLIKKDDRWWLFFEALNTKTNQGDIAVASSADTKSWHYERVVLDEPFHLSYPYVFENNGEFYMLPESAEAGELRLYRARSFPFQWELCATLLKGTFLDSSIAFYQGMWWLFTTTSRQNDELALYFAKDLIGPWQVHPASPIVRHDPYRSRPGGRVIELNGHLLRFAQIDQPNYGQGIRAFEVLKLTTDAYEEKEASTQPIIQASGVGWNAAGMHQVDAHQVDDHTWLASVDGYRVVHSFGYPQRASSGD
jgi:hypothetical protein